MGSDYRKALYWYTLMPDVVWAGPTLLKQHPDIKTTLSARSHTHQLDFLHFNLVT